jgi:hypothetical protein
MNYNLKYQRTIFSKTYSIVVYELYPNHFICKFSFLLESVDTNAYTNYFIPLFFYLFVSFLNQTI